MSVLIRQAKVIDPNSSFHNHVVDLLIENGKVQDISASIGGTADTILEVPGLCVSPGFVDVFADYREPGYEHKETIATGLNAAAAGGFTDVLLAPNTLPAVTSKSGVQYVLQQAKNHVVHAHSLGAITQDIAGKALAEMMDMHRSGAIAFTDGWLPLQNANLMLKAMEYVSAFKGLLLQIPLDASLASGGLMHEGVLSTQLGMPGIPVLAETIMIHRDIALLRYTGSRLHITGVSTAAGLEMIRAAKQEGLDITCSVTPYHLALTDEALKGYDSVYKVAPVLRSEADRLALISGLEDGTIDCIASHHRPQEWDAKAKEFESASDGMNIQEIAFQVMLEAVGGVISIERIIDALAVRPRAIFGISHPTVAKGADRLTFFSSEGSTNFTETNKESLSGNNPFLGKSLKGKIVGILGNNQVYLNN